MFYDLLCYHEKLHWNSDMKTNGFMITRNSGYHLVMYERNNDKCHQVICRNQKPFETYIVLISLH